MIRAVRRTPAAALVVLVFVAARPVAGEELRAELSVSRTIGPQAWVAFHIDPVAGVMTFEDPTLTTLTEDAQAALEEVPAWLAPDLAVAFYRMRAADQDALAASILEAEDPAYVDEIAFVVAHLAPEDIRDVRRLDDDIIAESVRFMYEHDASVEFADLVEHGEADDPERYTTVAYRILRDGEEDSLELPRDVYYWYVVHPVLQDERVAYIDPSRHRAADPPEGWFWRPYLWTDDPERSYQAANVLRSPNRITADTFAAWDLGDRARAFSHFTGLEVGPIEIVRADTLEPVAIFFTRGDQACGNTDYPNADGTYFATLSPVELAAANGQAQFLHNLVRAGGGNADLLPDDIIRWHDSPDAVETQPRGILIVRDRIPFDLAADPTEDAVLTWGREYDVSTSAELADLVLCSELSPFVNLAYNKIIVPSDQPRALYQALVDNTAKLERFVDLGGTLEIHGATRPEDDWSDLRLPGGIRCAPQDGTNEHDALAPYGYPLFTDIVPSAQYLWDGIDHMGLPGDRAFDPAETAIERVGWWVSQLMTWRIAEKDCWKRHMVPMRYVNPSDLVYDHYGNCGELQDVWSGTGRTAMIAIWNTGTIADDHMWNEFWQGERWHPVQVDWSDNDTRVGNWGIAYDADTAGAGKTIAALDGWRGDGLNITGLGRYPDTELDGHIWDDYSHHITLEATVEDADGNPVDGALVLIATPGLYDPESLSLTTWQYTGPDGVARITVGEGNDYYVQVTSTLGAIPDPDHVSEWITADEAVADSTHPYTFTLEGTMDLPDPDVVPATGEPTGSVTATIAATREIDHGTDLMTDRTFSEPYASGEVQVLLLTEAEYAGFVGETDFAAVVDMEEGDDIAVDEDLLGAGPFVLVVANKARVVMEQEVAIDVSLYGPAAVEGRDAGDDVEDAPAEAETGEQDVEEDVEPDGAADGADVTGTAGGGGCDCSAAGAGLPGLGPAALAALLLLRRRRHRRPRQEP